MSNASQVRKITARTVGLKKLAAGQSMTVLGKARRYESGQSDYGAYVKVKGTFEALNEESGERYRSSVVIFPGGLMEEELMEAIDQADAPVDVAIRFQMAEDSASPSGVTWQAEQLIEAEEADPLADLRNRVEALPRPEDQADG